jgi:hypothetical protein
MVRQARSLQLGYDKPLKFMRPLCDTGAAYVSPATAIAANAESHAAR